MADKTFEVGVRKLLGACPRSVRGIVHDVYILVVTRVVRENRVGYASSGGRSIVRRANRQV